MIRKTYCLSTATMVARTRLNVTLYLHCLCYSSYCTSVHTTSKKQSLWILFAIALTFLQIFPNISGSFFIVLLQLLLGLRRLSCMSGFQLTACFSMAEKSFLSVRLIHVNFSICSIVFSNNTYLT